MDDRVPRALTIAGLVVASHTATFCRAAFAQSESDVLGWIESELQQVGAFPGISGVAIRFGELFHPELSPGQLARLKAEVAGKPDHPGHQQLIVETRRRKQGPDARERIIWALGPGEWRINQS